MQSGFSPGIVVAVSLSAVHQFSKPVQKSIRLLVGLGVEGENSGHGRGARGVDSPLSG